MTDTLAPRFDAAIAAARTAGALALRAFGDRGSLAVMRTAPQDVHTDADVAVERAIVAALRAQFPEDAFLAEEEMRANGERCWVIDPIDGTANFARGLPNWCVSIAFADAGAIEIGVIFDPVHDKLYAARRGRGAHCNGRSLRVSGIADPAQATIEIGYSSRVATADYAHCVSTLAAAGANVMQLGSAALGLARVAEGTLDGYAERHLYAWDALAGMLLVEEAGGRVRPFLEGDALAAGNAVVAATPGIYAAIDAALFSA